MRLSVLPLLLAGASVAGLVAAEPIRVIDTANANIRFGHALANANVNGNDDNVARVIRAVPVPPSEQYKNKGLARHLCGASLREKALRLSNAFRHALGLPLIEPDHQMVKTSSIHIFPYPNAIVHHQEELDEEGKPSVHHGQDSPDSDHGHHGDHSHRGDHRHHRQHHHKSKSFLRRIHRAIRALGPWEGRAVAFVLGCGIGVLLRMFWVLSVLAYRTVRGEREELLDREYYVYEQVPETLFVAPPQYTDDKIRVETHDEIEEHK